MKFDIIYEGITNNIRELVNDWLKNHNNCIIKFINQSTVNESYMAISIFYIED
jgi:hypothetical protein